MHTKKSRRHLSFPQSVRMADGDCEAAILKSRSHSLIIEGTSRFTLLCIFLVAQTSFAIISGMDNSATAINALGLDLLTRTGKPDENALLSPYSIQCALAMAYAGADGVTKAEMAKALHYNSDEAELHLSFA